MSLILHARRSVEWGALLHALPFAALIVLAAALSYRYHTLLRDQRNRVDHTYEVLTRLQSTLVEMIDAETGQRGYVITGDGRYLQPYARAVAETPTALKALRTLVADSVVEGVRVDALERLTTIKFSELQQTIDTFSTSGPNAAREVVMRDRGRAAMDDLRSVVAAIEKTELDLLAERTSEVRSTERHLLAITVLCATLSLFARVALAWRSYRRTRPVKPSA